MVSTPARVERHAARVAAGSNEPIQPVRVKTITVRAGGSTQTGSLTPVGAQKPVAPVVATPSTPAAAQASKPTSPAAPQSAAAPTTSDGELPRPALITMPPEEKTVEPAAKPAETSVAATTATTPAARASAKESASKPAEATPAATPATTTASSPAEVAAAAQASKVLDGTDPFTESVEKGGNTLYRARFAGFDKQKAEAACKALKRDGVDCVTIKN
jgi:D-alanyl-D-alanine carboxypeptidase